MSCSKTFIFLTLVSLTVSIPCFAKDMSQAIEETGKTVPEGDITGKVVGAASSTCFFRMVYEKGGDVGPQHNNPAIRMSLRKEGDISAFQTDLLIAPGYRLAKFESKTGVVKVRISIKPESLGEPGTKQSVEIHLNQKKGSAAKISSVSMSDTRRGPNPLTCQFNQ